MKPVQLRDDECGRAATSISLEFGSPGLDSNAPAKREKANSVPGQTRQNIFSCASSTEFFFVRVRALGEDVRMSCDRSMTFRSVASETIAPGPCSSRSKMIASAPTCCVDQQFFQLAFAQHRAGSIVGRFESFRPANDTADCANCVVGIESSLRARASRDIDRIALSAPDERREVRRLRAISLSSAQSIQRNHVQCEARPGLGSEMPGVAIGRIPTRGR